MIKEVMMPKEWYAQVRQGQIDETNRRIELDQAYKAVDPSFNPRTQDNPYYTNCAARQAMGLPPLYSGFKN